MALSPAAGRLMHHLRRLPAVLGVLLLVGAIYAVQKEFRHLKLEDVATALGGKGPDMRDSILMGMPSSEDFPSTVVRARSMTSPITSET